MELIDEVPFDRAQSTQQAGGGYGCIRHPLVTRAS